jgi:hypothetical protein
MQTHQLAQINIGRLVAPLDDPRIGGFISQLDSINALAESSPGYVWRLQSEQGNATDLAYNDDPFMIVNMSVWESIEALKAFTYRTRHLQVLRDRKQWFEPLDLPHYCLWWVPSGHHPSIAEGRSKLEHYQRHGSTPEAFWFSEWYPMPTGEVLIPA